MPSNNLRDEKSPYLIQHADNPVNWYPWGDEAFEKARNEDKPILVSIGYSTCHWCHVMAEESFEDPEVAALMNENLVSIKIDREERPDLDQIYISAVSAMTGSAGWPLNVFLTPDGRPFYGGTYFPPTKRVSPAWKDIVTAIGSAWHDEEKRDQLLESANRVTQLLKTHLGGQAEGTVKDVVITPETLDKAVEAISRLYDQANGGFSKAPKFPMPSMIRFLLFYNRFAAHSRRHPERARQAADMAFHSLERIADGGIYDHVGGGFHRYSTDEKWHVPHFEKMLYDNAQLIDVYLEAYGSTGRKRFAEVAEESLNYVLRDMTHPEGGFCSAEDADSLYREVMPSSAGETRESEKSEGGFYVWKHSEIKHLLDEAVADIFIFHFDIQKNGNVFNDPMAEFTGKNVLHRTHTISETATRFNLTEPEIEQILKDAGKELFAARENRPRPHLDDKVLVEWNGLMISALARGYRVLGNRLYYEAAEKAIMFIYENMYDRDEKILYRRWREGERKISAMATDYAFLVRGLLDIYESDFDPWMLNWAVELSRIMIDRFHDEGQGGFFTTHEGQDENLLFHVKDVTDSVLPSAASVGALNCIRLYRWTGRDIYFQVAEQTLRAGRSRMSEQPSSVPEMMVAQGVDMLRSAEVVIVGKKDAEDTKAFLETIRAYPPETRQIVLVPDKGVRDTLAMHMPHLEQMDTETGGALAYICYNQACQNPVSDARELDQLLSRAFDPPLRTLG